MAKDLRRRGKAVSEQKMHQRYEELGMNEKIYEFEAVICKVPDIDGAYVVFPWDVKAEFGKGRVKVSATFDGEAYEGSLVNMGVKREDGSICHILGFKKDIRAKLGKQSGDMVKVTVKER